jgi:MYXO-CTERM domain-containing protein
MNRSAILSLLAGLLAIAQPARGFVRESSNWNPASLPIRYNINLSSAPAEIGASGAQSAVDMGFASWAAPACSAWRTTDAGDTTRGASASDRSNTILWVSGSWPATLGDVNSVIGVTTPVWTSGGYFIDADIQFNNVGFTWSMTGSSGTVDTQSIATHEEGHFLGLDHSPTGSAIMYASYSGGLKRTLDCDDIRGVCAIYPSGMDIPSTCGGGSTMMMMGTGATGSPCNAPSDCTSGLCVSDGTNQFCSAMCSDDCGCPVGYHCFPTTMAGVNVCAAGANQCAPTTRDSGTMVPPMGRPFGDPCDGPTDCTSNLCAHESGATAGFCTRACADDSTCPCGYQCYPTTTGPHVCGPGTDTCASREDAGVTIGGDVGTVADAASPAVDAGTDARRDAGTGDSSPSCGCTVPGGSHAKSGWLGAMLAAFAVSAVRRRRRG